MVRRISGLTDGLGNVVLAALTAAVRLRLVDLGLCFHGFSLGRLRLALRVRVGVPDVLHRDPDRLKAHMRPGIEITYER